MRYLRINVKRCFIPFIQVFGLAVSREVVELTFTPPIKITHLAIDAGLEILGTCIIPSTRQRRLTLVSPLGIATYLGVLSARNIEFLTREGLVKEPHENVQGQFTGYGD